MRRRRIPYGFAGVAIVVALVVALALQPFSSLAGWIAFGLVVLISLVLWPLSGFWN
ncbi:hypothetical protein [Baekduia sp. Peel2402]|uniref:hypothetical protein n=1 Tax=Baekduia sp. Peel2402 TaxID=3458296 RepID=UPI00403E6748